MDRRPEPEALEQTDETFCYGHPGTPTRLRCTRCDKPICGRCAVPASVGQHCVWCVAEDRKNAPKVRSTLQATSPAVLTIIAANVIIWMGQNFIPQITQSFSSNPFAIANGEWWRLLTAMFLHAPFTGALFSLLHIGFNMYILRIFGPHVEQAFGTVRFVPMYLVAGFAGSAASYSVGCRAGVGASGAIFGVVGILLALLYRRRTSAFVATYMKNLLFFVGINLIIGFSIAMIDNAAHIGGLAAGLAVGYAAGDPQTTPGTALRTILALLAVSGAAVALVGYRTATFAC